MKNRKMKMIGAVLLSLCVVQAACAGEEPGTAETEAEMPIPGAVFLDENWTYAGNSMIHTGAAEMYLAREDSGADRKNITVCVNAGHGTSGASDVRTLSHPDGTPKVTGGTNAEGAVYSSAISTGTTFPDGTTEASANLRVAIELKGLLLSDGYDVLMIRESDDVQLDNIARTVIANNCADLHVAIHFDSTESDKGAFYCSVPNVDSYLAMEPVASCREGHEALGRALIEGFQECGYALYGQGALEMDLTQTSYSTIPSVDIEVGDRASDHSPDACAGYARALKKGIDHFAERVLVLR